MNEPHYDRLVESSRRAKMFARERDEILRHKWIESEKAGVDIGFERALLGWVIRHRSAWRAQPSGGCWPGSPARIRRSLLRASGRVHAVSHGVPLALSPRVRSRGHPWRFLPGGPARAGGPAGGLVHPRVADRA